MSDARPRRGCVPWDGVDWSQTDAAVARRLGVSPSAVRVQRVRRGHPPAAAWAADAFRDYVRLHRDRLAGLSVAAAVRAAGCRVSRPAAAAVLREVFGAGPVSRPGGGWDGVDWALPDAAIARATGRSKQAVNWQRRARGLGSSVGTHPAAAFRAFAAAHAGRLHGLTVAAVRDLFRAETGLAVAAAAARPVLRAVGVRLLPRQLHRSRLGAADWRLPNIVLAAVWGVPLQTVLDYRSRKRLGRPAWDGRRPADLLDPAYLAAAAAERRKAAGGH